VSQAYVSHHGTGAFVARLGAFERTELAPGESRQVGVAIDPRLLARFDDRKRKWVIAGGRYDVRVAGNAAEAGVAGSVDVKAAEFGP